MNVSDHTLMIITYLPRDSSNDGCRALDIEMWDSLVYFSIYARNLGYGVRLSGLRAYVDTCVSVVG